MEDRRARKRDKTRNALLSGALRLFSQRGIYEPSIEEITSSADVGKGTFYQYFSSREALIAELVQIGFAHLLAEVEARVKALGEGEDPLPTVLEAHREFFCDHPENLLLFHQARGWMKMEGSQCEEIRRAFKGYVTHLGRFLDTSREEPTEVLSRRAIVVAGFIGGVLSFEKILGVDDPAEKLGEELALIAQSFPPPGTQSWGVERKGDA